MSSVYTWGCGFEGRLGNGNGDDECRGLLIHIAELENRPIKFVSAGRKVTAVLTEDGELIIYGEVISNRQNLRVSIKELIPGAVVRGVACGLNNVAFYTEKNEVFAWGDAFNPEKGPKIVHKFEENVKIKQIACGALHCLVLTDYGVYGYGNNHSGQLGLENTRGGMMMYGNVQHKELQPIKALSDKNIVKIACGGYHSLALTDRGEVFGFGAGNYGQLGNGSVINKSPVILAKALAGKKINFIAAGPSHSIAISTDGKAYLFGRTESKQCNCNAPENACVKPVEVSIKDEYFVYGAASHSCTYLVTVSGRIFSYGTLWGEEIYNTNFIGQGQTLNDKFIHQIWCGHYHAIAVVGDMRVNISPSTFISNMQTAFTDTIHKDITLITSHTKKQVHSVIFSALSDVVRAKLLDDKMIYFSNTIDLTNELAELPQQLFEAIVQYCYGISCEVNKDDLKLLTKVGETLKFEALVSECKRLEPTNETFLSIPSKSLTNALESVFKAQDERTADITFTFNNSSDKLHAHKIILSSRCEYFRGLFDLGMKESKQDTMHISEWSVESFRVMLAFLYNDQLTGVTGENALEVLQLATTYLIQRLIDKCEEFIVENMTLDTIVELYLFSETLNVKQIQRGCQFFVRREMYQKPIETLPGYEKLSDTQQEQLKHFLSGKPIGTDNNNNNEKPSESSRCIIS